MATRGGRARAGAREAVAEVTWGRRRRPAVRKGAGPTIGPSEGGGSMSDIYKRHPNHWRKAQRRLTEPPNPPEPPRRERGPRTLDSLLAGKRRKAPWK